MPKPITDQNGRIKLPNLNTFISPEMIEDIIGMSEAAITAYKLQQAEINEPMLKAEKDMNEAYEYYMNAKKSYDSYKKYYDDIEDNIKRKKNIIALHNHIKTGKKLEDVTVFEKISNNTVKIKKRAARIPWTQLAAEYLAKKKKFSPPVALFRGILDENPEVKKEFLSHVSHNSSRETVLIQNLVRSASREPRKPGARGGHKILIREYKGQIGLPEWFDQDGQINVNYLNYFWG